MSSSNILQYLFLNSAGRDRTRDPNPCDFLARAEGVGTADMVASLAPIVNVNMYHMFDGTDGPLLPTFWYKDITIVAPVLATTTTQLTITFVLPSPIPLRTGLYDGLRLSYFDGVGTEVVQVAEFENLQDGTYSVVLDTPITFNPAFTAARFETYVLTTATVYVTADHPLPNVQDAFRGLVIADLSSGSGPFPYSSVSAYEPSSRILTLEPPWTSTVPVSRFGLFSGPPPLAPAITATTATTITLGGTTLGAGWSGAWLYNVEEERAVMAIAAQQVGPDVVLTTREPHGMVVGERVMVLVDLHINEQPLRSPTQFGQMPMCWDLSLEALCLPLKPVRGYPGGYLVNYPWVYVDLLPRSGFGSSQPMLSNDPAAALATFVVPILDISTPEYSSFTRLSSSMTQTVKLLPGETVRLRVRRTDGTVLAFVEEDAMSPEPPNPFLQVSALFSLRPSALV